MAALVAKDLLNDAQTLLQDTGAKRWSLVGLTRALNDGLLEICMIKPSACAETVVLDLVEGTLQSLEEGQSQFLRVVRNITSAAGVTPVVGGRIISVIEQAALDTQIPNWHDTNVVPFGKTVAHIVFDELNPRSFYVYPGNDGTGRIEAMLAVEPSMVSLPADPTDVDNYTDEIDISPVYKSALLDFMLYRSYAMDMQVAGGAQRASMYLQSFNQKLGLRAQSEAVANPETA